MDDEKLMEKAQQLGVEYERRYMGCGQCTIAALQEVFDIHDPGVFKAASAFAGGVGLAGDGCCGAYLGATMMLSYLRGRTRDNFADPNRVRGESYRTTMLLHDRFIAEYGTVTCRDIHTRIFGRPYYIADPDELAKFDAAGAHNDKCPSVVGNAAGWAARIILEEGLLDN